MEEALKRSFRYLSRKMYTVEELSEKLRRDGFPPEVVEETALFLQDKGYLNDQEYIRTYLESIKSHRPKGFFAIRDELRRKGIPASQLSSLREEFYPLEEELKDALTILERERERNINDLEKLRQKLTRRGFTWEVIERALLHWEEDRP